MVRDRFPEVYGLGQCSLDYIGKIASYPPADSKCEFTGLVVQGGGPVATALVALSRWGNHCTFAGVIGDDPFGKQIRAGLEAEGIDLRGLLVRKGFESQFAFIAAEPGLGRRSIFWQRPTGPSPDPEELDFDLIRRPAYPAAAVDTTGCGDVFHAGFIYGLLKNWTVEQSLDWGAWAASRVSLKLGGRAGIPPLLDWMK